MPTNPSPPTPGGIGWKVLSQVEQSQPGQGGRFVNGVRVTFQLSDGQTTASVFVPYTNYTAEGVSAAIAPLALELTKVANLQG